MPWALYPQPIDALEPLTARSHTWVYFPQTPRIPMFRCQTMNINAVKYFFPRIITLNGKLDDRKLKLFLPPVPFFTKLSCEGPP